MLLIGVWACALFLAVNTISYFKHLQLKTSPFANLFPSAYFLSLVILFAALVRSRISPKHSAYLIAFVTGLGSACTLAFILRKTDYNLGGRWADAMLHLGLVNKAREGLGWMDVAHKGLSQFYPPLWFQALGSIGKLLGVNAPHTLQWGGLATIIMLPIVLTYSWSRYLPWIGALATALLSCSVYVISIQFKPYEIIASTLFIPWWLRYVGSTAEFHLSKPYKEWVTGGVLGGLLFLTFYYAFFIGALLLVARISLVPFAHNKQTPPLRHVAAVCILSAIIAAPYWLPLLIDMLKLGTESLQNRWFTSSMSKIPLAQTLSLNGAIGLFGAGYLLFFPHEHQLAKEMRALLVSALVWYVLGFVTTALNSPLLHTKADLFLNSLCVAGGVHGMHTIVTHTRIREFVLNLIVGLALLVLGHTHKDLAENALVKSAIRARNKKEPSSANPYLFRGRVLLTNGKSSWVYNPQYTFIIYNAHYAHPASLFNQRVAFLTDVATLKSGEDLCWFLKNNRFNTVDFVSLPQHEIKLSLDDFPKGSISHITKFPQHLFSAGCFEHIGNTDKYLYRVHDPGKTRLATFDKRALTLAMRYASEPWNRYAKKRLHNEISP